jgi:hypothetical protein
MQPLAIAVLAVTVVMILGVVTTLFLTRNNGAAGRFAISRWHQHGSIPLAGAGLVFAAISRASGLALAPATQDVVYAAATTLLIGALLCALTGAVASTRRQHGGDRA